MMFNGGLASPKPNGRPSHRLEQENKGSRVNVQMRMSGPIIMRKGVRGDLQKLKELLEKQTKVSI